MAPGQLRKNFFDFFEKREHQIVPFSSLIPDDPSVLFTTAGMQQFKLYYLGLADAFKTVLPALGRAIGSQRATSIQKCLRTSDIDEVGDETHLTFFEMLGHFSFGPRGKDEPDDFGVGGYFKKASIYWGYEFIKEVLGLKIDYVSIFGGEDNLLTDEESEKFWQEIKKKKGENFEIKKFGKKDNFWGPAGESGPCGPNTEIYVKGVEIWNAVFNQYEQKKDGSLVLLKNPGVDMGAGFERILAVLKGTTDVYQTDVFKPILDILPDFNLRDRRIIADHLKASVFLIAEGILPSNLERGYVLRRLLRRAILKIKRFDLDDEIYHQLISRIIEIYKDVYPEINHQQVILNVINEEKIKFFSTLNKGLKQIEKLKTINGKLAFDIFQSFGFPLELIIEETKNYFSLTDEQKKKITEEFEEELKKHKEISRAGAEKKFGGHGLILNTGEIKAASQEEIQKVIRLHTATHLLQQALRDVLGNEVEQRGSDITVERTRFDFSFSRKMTVEEIKKAEDIVNQKIKEDLPINFQEMSESEAEKTGALYFFKAKYPGIVKVYYIGSSLASAYSKEFCAGPHVKHTGEIGKFKILKEEAVALGIRRIRAKVE